MKFNLKKRLVLVISSVVVLVFLAGCLPGITGPSRDGDGGRATGGNTGVVVKIVDPPREIFEDRDFYIVVSLENPTTEMISGTLTLFDEEGDTFGGVPTGGNSQSFSLIGAEIIDGRISPEAPLELEFGPYRYTSSERINIKDAFSGTVIRAKINYDDFPVDIEAPICVESTSVRDRGCRESPTGRIANLGDVARFAPVTIKNIDRSIAPGKEDAVSLFLELFLTNQGGGKIDNAEEELDFNIGLVSSGDVFDCKPKQGMIKLRTPKMETVIKCVADISIPEGYRNDFLRINLRYPYEFEVDAIQIPVVPEFLE